MSYGVSLSIITKGDPIFLLDIHGFITYEPKFIAVTIDWTALSDGIEGFLEKQQTGFLWMTIVSIAYLVIGVGFTTTLVIHRYQYLAREGTAVDEH